MRLGSIEMDADAFMAALRSGSYAIEDFRHLDHLRLGWILLATMDAASAADEAARIIRAFGLRHGKGHAYHETITRAWMRLLASHEEASFEEFLARNESRISADLLHWFWKPETLSSSQARTEWVAPDLRALPPISARGLA